METQKGKLVYMVYRALTYGLSPFLHLHLQWRRLRGLEHSLRWPERLGRPSLARPPGPLLWFHAVSLGEGMAAIPVIKHCVRQRPDINILMTATTASAFLPLSILLLQWNLSLGIGTQMLLCLWKVNCGPTLSWELLEEDSLQIVVSLLNARVSMKSFNLWSGTVAQSLILLMLSKFSLIIPLSTVEAIHFQLLQAPPFIINFAGDLKYVILAVHEVLMQTYPDMVTIIVPRHPRQRKQIALALRREGLEVVFRSREEKIMPSTNIYMADTLGELQSLYRLTPIAVIGGSFFPGLAGHNFSEAAAAGCAILTGHHIGHFSHMVSSMKHSNSLAVLQVSGKAELVEALNELFSNACALEARRTAAKQAFLALSNGIIEKVWNLIDLHVIKKAFNI